MLLLCSCAPPRQVEKAAGEKASKPFPPKYYAPAIHASNALVPGRLSTTPLLERAPVHAETHAQARPCPACKPTVRTDTVYLAAAEPLDSMQRELQIEQLANQAIRKRLSQAEEDRDYWQEKNEQKFWALVAMGVFGFLYILFTLLASRIKES